ncbi:uncharacterized protein LOC133147269 [Syngnathus typhle]|uniref:uncharacterized protein LOC133147086 n=1 Tax=Syngnathus typhle TaxID=161592 RepID=UPI002A6B8CB7|nr:uncharacterized protein LOC133147086 [Syngnathus typhle]XP_061127237.1 uncharacterized protein LOC133147269 [Syngnathus typhle]
MKNLIESIQIADCLLYILTVGVCMPTLQTLRIIFISLQIYVEKTLNVRVIRDMSMVVNNILECITIEILKERKKNVIIRCIYRTPGSSIELFTEWMEEVFSKVSCKTIFISGDFNIDLLNPNKHKLTEHFVNTIYSMNLYPKITRPTRITSHCATLIDNIFTNYILNNTISGLLVSDISDHLPVFMGFDDNYKIIQLARKQEYRRIKTEETINAFKNGLMSQNWDIICNKNNINCAYEEFLKIFKRLYDKYCPVKVNNRKLKYVNHPWITKGLQNACKEKNTIYREFIRQRTKEAENKYKQYKNKLTNIKRAARKEYYSKILNDNKNNTKEIWNIMNTVIKNGSKKIDYPKYFIIRNTEKKWLKTSIHSL